MKMFKYKVPDAVTKALFDNDITSVNYRSREYFSLKVNACKNHGPFKEDDVLSLINNDDYTMDDFEEIIPKDQTFNLALDNIENIINNLDFNISDDACGYVVKVCSNYRTTMYFKKTRDTICRISDNAQEGINNNIRSYLKNKMQGNLFYFEIEELLYDDLEHVYKFYYYDENYILNSSTGAGTLTGWLTAEAIEKRANGKTIITLNRNYRVTEDFLKTKG